MFWEWLNNGTALLPTSLMIGMSTYEHPTIGTCPCVVQTLQR